MTVPGDSPLIGKSIGELKFWQSTGGTIVAIRRGQTVILSPGPYAELYGGDVIILVGSPGAAEAAPPASNDKRSEGSHMIQFEHVSKSYGKTPVLKDLNFTIPDGQFVVLIGPSGCGKTTTMKMINRLLEPDTGSILIDGKDIHSQDKVELRRHIGYVIQQIGLFPNMTVAQNICVVPKLLKYDKARCDEIVQEMLQLVHMEQYANKYPSELSGGQQQRNRRAAGPGGLSPHRADG